MNKTDVVLAKAFLHEGSTKDNRVVDFSIVFEWNIPIKDGIDREGAMYALHLNDAIARNKFLIFTVAPGQFQVFGLYWVADEFRVQRVQLAEHTRPSRYLSYRSRRRVPRVYKEKTRTRLNFWVGLSFGKCTTM
jgi:hypothetical protein